MRSRPGVAHVLSAVLSRNRERHKAPPDDARGRPRLRHVSAGTRDSNPVLPRRDTRHAARGNRRLKAGERGKRLPPGLFPCLFRHSAAVCRVDQGKESRYPRAENPALHDSIRRACAWTETGETLVPNSASPRSIRHAARRASLISAACDGACWQKDGRRQCTRHSARAPRGMNGRMPPEQALAERGRERPSGVRRQGTCRAWEGGRSRPRCVVALYRRRRQRTRAANTAARHRRL